MTCEHGLEKKSNVDCDIAIQLESVPQMKHRVSGYDIRVKV